MLCPLEFVCRVCVCVCVKRAYCEICKIRTTPVHGGRRGHWSSDFCQWLVLHSARVSDTFCIHWQQWVTRFTFNDTEWHVLHSLMTLSDTFYIQQHWVTRSKFSSTEQHILHSTTVLLSTATKHLPFLLGAGIVQWSECRTRDRKVAGSNPCGTGGRIFFSRVNFLCWLLFRYPFHPRVTAVTRKRPLSFCQKCRWQVTAKHGCTLHMWLCMKWHGAWLYGVHRTRRDGSSFMWHQTCQRCKYTIPVDIQKRAIKT